MSAPTTEAPTTLPAPGRRRRGAGWGVPLRIARRETMRAKGRSALVLLLVLLPVLVVTVLSTLLRTALVSTEESLPRELGASDVAVRLHWDVPEGQVLVQCPDLSCTTSALATGDPVPDLPPEDAIRAVLGPQARVVAVPTQYLDLTVGDRTFYGLISEADLTDPLFAGMLELVEGRAPAAPGEIAVSEPVAARGSGIGTSLDLGGYGTGHVVGIVRDHRAPDEVVGAPGGLGVPFVDGDLPNEWSRWLVEVPGGVSWEQVLGLNAHGLTALSRQVVTDPPTEAELAADPRTQGLNSAEFDDGPNSTAIAVVGLIVAMVLLEVVLLAGPAFAVSASSQTRALGLIAAQGGGRRELRRVVLGQAVVLGAIAAVVGVVVGVVGTRLVYPLLVQALGPAQVGPFEVGWFDLALVAIFGFGSALVAALAPARAAARMDPVRAIAGRRPEARTTQWHPVLGAVLVGAGIGLALAGAANSASSGRGAGSLLIAAGAVAAVLGAVLIAPLAIRLLARLATVAPVSVRYAVRDMARNQLRTAPAVAAVAAVVAGAVALGIAGTSDAAERRAEYVPGGPVGDAVVRVYSGEGLVEESTWAGLAEELSAQHPTASTVLVPGAHDPFLEYVPGQTGLALTASTVLPEIPDPVFAPGTPGFAQQAYQSYIRGWWYSSGILAGHDGLAAIGTALTDEQRQRAEAALADGAAVVLRNSPAPDQGTATFDVVVVADLPDSDDPQEDVGPTSRQTLTVPAIGLQLPGISVPAAAIVPDSLLREARLEPITVALVLDAEADLTRVDEERLQNAVNTSPTLKPEALTASVSLETGWTDDARVVLMILALTAGVLVLAGSMTAALLALSDARPDFATLGAVGAAPRTRRRIAAAYGWAIAFLGALLGAAVGFIPGVAITYPLTADPDGHLVDQGLVDLSGAPIAAHYLVIPWPLIVALVVALPILVGVVVGATTRSRLPMAARIE